MTKRHFVALADALRPYLEKGKSPNDDRVNIPVGELVAFMRGENPHFNEWRWRSYLRGECGPNGGKR